MENFSRNLKKKKVFSSNDWVELHANKRKLGEVIPSRETILESHEIKNGKKEKKEKKTKEIHKNRTKEIHKDREKEKQKDRTKEISKDASNKTKDVKSNKQSSEQGDKNADEAREEGKNGRKDGSAERMILQDCFKTLMSQKNERALKAELMKVLKKKEFKSFIQDIKSFCPLKEAKNNKKSTENTTVEEKKKEKTIKKNGKKNEDPSELEAILNKHFHMINEGKSIQEAANAKTPGKVRATKGLPMNRKEEGKNANENALLKNKGTDKVGQALKQSEKTSVKNKASHNEPKKRIENALKLHSENKESLKGQKGGNGRVTKDSEPPEPGRHTGTAKQKCSEKGSVRGVTEQLSENTTPVVLTASPDADLQHSNNANCYSCGVSDILCGALYATQIIAVTLKIG